MRVGALDEPERMPSEVRVFTATQQPWVLLPPGAPTFDDCDEREGFWPPARLARRQALLPRIEAHQATLRR